MRATISDGLPAEDSIFLAPIVYTPQHGKDLTKSYLTAAFHVFFNSSFCYVREILGSSDAMLEFETEIDQVEQAGKIVEFKVMIRPLKAINVIHERMAAVLAATQKPK